jgi:hypothetical protein
MQNTEVRKKSDSGYKYTKGTMTIKKQKIILRAFLLFFTGLFFFSCKDKGTDPISVEDIGFRFKVSVKDNAGNPVNGLRISAWGVLSIENQLNKTSISSQLNKVNKIQAQTSLTFSLAQKAYVIFSIFNLRDQEIVRLTNEPKLAGLYQVSWNAPSTPSSVVPPGVYKCRLFAKSTTSDSVLFQDSIYAVLHHFDPEVTVLGWTSQSGIFETTNTLLFPKVLDPPTLLQTNSTGPEIIETFNYTDSIAVFLTDTTTHKQQLYYLTIGKQTNTFNLTWNPPNNLSVSIKQDFSPVTKLRSIAADTVIEVRPTAEWKLYQNYPNPFN